MLLQKLRGSHCCLLDVAPFPLGELGGLKVSRSGVDSGIGESVATGSLSHSVAAPPADRPQSPGPKNHSVTLHNLVRLCLQQEPEHRSWKEQSLLFYEYSNMIVFICAQTLMPDGIQYISTFSQVLNVSILFQTPVQFTSRHHTFTPLYLFNRFNYCFAQSFTQLVHFK